MEIGVSRINYLGDAKWLKKYNQMNLKS